MNSPRDRQPMGFPQFWHTSKLQLSYHLVYIEFELNVFNLCAQNKTNAQTHKHTIMKSLNLKLVQMHFTLLETHIHF